MNRRILQAYGYVAGIFKKIVVMAASHPIVTAIISMAAYFLVLQPAFIRMGDIWAELYMEYLHKAIGSGWETVIAPSWEGYVTFLPSFFVKLYVSLGAPLGYVDVFFRAVTVLFVVGCFAVLASRLASNLWPRLWQRLVVIIALLMTLWHVSSFSYINIWYVGFIPIVVLAISAVPMKVWQRTAYTLFGLAIAFTKPSIILVPFVVYRAIKTKEYISNALIAGAALLQTYLLFFATSNGERHVASELFGVVKMMYVGAGGEVLKILHIAPNDALVLVANLFVVLLFALLVWRRGWLVGGLMAMGFLFAVYSYVLAPGPTLTSFSTTATELFNDYFKLQREILIAGFFILANGLLLPDAWRLVKTRTPKMWRPYAYAAFVALLLGCGGLLYRPIDATSGRVAIDITQFRSSLSMRLPTCMPVAPLPSWSPDTSWFLAYRGGCSFVGPKVAPDATAMTVPAAALPRVVIAGHDQQNLMTVMVPVKVTMPTTSRVFYLKDDESKMIFVGRTVATHDTDVQFVAFNLAGMPGQAQYSFTVRSDSEAYLAPTADAAGVIAYAYFMGEAY